MPKKGRKRLTQRKGTSISGLSTKSRRTSTSIDLSDDNNVSIIENTQTICRTTPDITNISLGAPTKEELPAISEEPPKKKIRILQNILITPAPHTVGASPILEKGKKRISYCSSPIPEDTYYDPYLPPKQWNKIQHVVQLILYNKNKISEILCELSLEHERSLITKMIPLFPLTKADRTEAAPSFSDVLSPEREPSDTAPQRLSTGSPTTSTVHVYADIIIHHSANSQIEMGQESISRLPSVHIESAVNTKTDAIVHRSMTSQHDIEQVLPPELPTAVRQPPDQLDAITILDPTPIEDNIVEHRPHRNDPEIDLILIAIENDARRDEQARIRAAIQQERQEIADLQRQVNRYIDPNNTYLMATARILRGAPSYLGPLTNMCTYCSALYFAAENRQGGYTKCCRKGKVALPHLQPMPNLLRNLFDGTHPHSANFKQNILKFNYAFQFVSLEATLRDLPPGRSPQVYIIQGKVYHNISNVNVNNPRQRYGPIYFLTPDDAIDQRNRNNQDLDPDTIRSIELLLRDINPYAQAYAHLRDRYNLELEIIERMREQDARQNLRHVPPLAMPEISLDLMAVRGAHNRHYDVPAIPEMAVVYNANPDSPPTPDLKLFIRNNPTRFCHVSNESELLDPLVFPLLFPLGEPGWHIRMPHAQGNKYVTLCEYYAFRLAIRDNDRRFRYGQKLTQQYVVSAYVKVEANNLKFIANNQAKLRAESYTGLADYLHRRINEHDEGFNLGRMVILPSTFIGSPRSQQQLYQDAMAIVAKHGFPSLFITMTTNPRWPEITENIPQGTQPCDHPMLLARVFQAKLDELMRDILDSHVFGVPISSIHVIEFQKRGLPHAHILVILRNEDKLVDPERIDMLVSAEIPDPTTEPELYEIVTKNMIHGPCGVLNPDSPCMVDGKCSKGFPKQFSPVTWMDEHGRMTYRRRDNGRTFTTVVNRREVTLDNRWVVPYNPYTLLKYICHINIEACATVECVKYLYKYLFKQLEQALVRIIAAHELHYNEIESFMNARYMSPPEASWHLNQFPLHKNTHSVIRLCVHLPVEQIVRFQPGFEMEALQRNETTKLTAWFLLNRVDPQANQYLYTDIPEHYVWRTNPKGWTRRQRLHEKIVVRMYSVNVRNQELYYLRLLLLHVRGAQSYEDVRTVEDEICNTFKEACQLRGLLADDIEWIRALEEASQRDMPYQMRQMFAFMLLFCEISDKESLLNRFINSFTEDFTRHDIPLEEAIRLALTDIQDILVLHGAHLSQFGLPEPPRAPPHREIIDVNNERLQGENLKEQLNPEQRDLFEKVMDSIRDEHFATDRLFLINAAAGSGKSFVFQTLISVLRGEDVPVVALAPTGLAASLLKGGRTLHSRFKIPLDVNETTTSGVTPTSADGRIIAASKLIIIDEISMVTRLIFNLLERTLRDLCDSNQPFGNKTVLLAGDFRQTLPIVLHGNRCSIVDACIKGSRHFPSFRQYHFHTNVRAGDNEDAFSRWLLQLGDGTLPSFRRTFYGDIVKLPFECVVDSKQALIDFCFGDLHSNRVPNKVILTPLNATCQDINDLILDKLPGSTKTYYSADSVDITDDPAAEVANYTVEFINTLNPTGLPSHRLTLKVGSIVMLLRNLNVKKGLINGTRLYVHVLGTRYIDAERIDTLGRLTGERVFIPRMDLTPASNILPFKLKRRQFPIKLSYALTINKSQGQTFDKVGIYLPTAVFAHGQLYVAFSRARNFQSIRVFVEETSIQGRLDPPSPEVYTRNIVYREVL